MRLTEKLELYIFQWFFHTVALRGQCDYIIELYKVLIFSLIALSHRVIASHLCEHNLDLLYPYTSCSWYIWKLIARKTDDNFSVTDFLRDHLKTSSESMPALNIPLKSENDLS